MEDFLLVKGNLGERGDADLYCIFDGHCGHLPAEIAANQFADVLWEEMTEIAELEDHLLSEMLDALSVECCCKHSNTNQYRVAIALHRTFGRICSDLKKMGAPGGTTALVALFLADDLFVANAGDTRCILSTNKGTVHHASTAHRPSDKKEEERIKLMGGNITDMSVPRVEGILAVSRALGDFDLAEKGIIWTPHIRLIPRYRDEHRYLVMASDGLWDFVSDAEVLRIANETLGYKVQAWRPRRRGPENDVASQSSTTVHSSSPPIRFPPPSSSLDKSHALRRIEPKPLPRGGGDFLGRDITNCQFSDEEDDLNDPCGKGKGTRPYGDDDEDLFQFENDVSLTQSAPVGKQPSQIWEKFGLAPFADLTASPNRSENDNSKEMKACEKLIERAFYEGKSGDNISVIIINFGM